MASQLDFPFPEIRLAPSRKSRVCWDGHGQPWFGLRAGLLRDSTPAVVYGVVTAAVYSVFGRDTTALAYSVAGLLCFDVVGVSGCRMSAGSHTSLTQNQNQSEYLLAPCKFTRKFVLRCIVGNITNNRLIF